MNLAVAVTSPRSRLAAIDRTWLLAASMLSVQIGGGVAGRLMEDIGAPAVVMFRQGGAALVLLAWCRPSLRGRSRREWTTIVAFGCVLAAMNTSFYSPIERLPLGIAVTVELVGPLGLAAALSRRAVDLVCVAVAVCGVVLLGSADGGLDPLGLVLALVAALCWASYILLSRSAGQQSTGIGSLGLVMAIAALLVAPAGLRAGSALAHPRTLALGSPVALLAGLVPFSLEMVALRHVPARVFGVLMSLSPVAAAASGLVLLGQHLSIRDAVAMAMVIAASVATVRAAAGRQPT
ncbi:MAG: EamA family transporter [Actinobacteria bacterium]|nr:EamA family transporter [Actinomycetota bacterium]